MSEKNIYDKFSLKLKTVYHLLAFIFLMVFATVCLAGDDSFASVKQFTLEDAIFYALQHNPSLAITQAKIDEQKGVIQSTRSGLLPHVDLDGNTLFARLNKGMVPGATPQFSRFDNILFDANAGVKMLVWDFKKTKTQLEAARHALAALKLFKDRQKEEVVFNVSHIYLKVLTYNDLISAAQSTEKSLQALKKRIVFLVKGGRAIPEDLLKVETRLSAVGSNIALLESGRKTALANLANAIGWQGSDIDVVYVPSQESPEAEKLLVEKKQLLLKAQRTRLDLVAFEKKLQAAKAQRIAAQKGKMPVITFNAGVAEYSAVNPVSFVGLITHFIPNASVGPGAAHPGNWQADWYAAVHVNFPLFDGGLRAGRIAARRAAEARAATEVLAKKLEVTKQLRSALASLEGSLARVEANKEALKQAKEVLRVENLRYKAGKTVIDFVLEAEAQLLNAKSRLSQAYRSVDVSTLAVHLAVGDISLKGKSP